MRIEDSERFPGWKKVVLDFDDAAGLDPAALECYAATFGATKLAAGKDEYIIQFQDQPETVLCQDQLESALYSCTLGDSMLTLRNILQESHGGRVRVNLDKGFSMDGTLIFEGSSRMGQKIDERFIILDCGRSVSFFLSEIKSVQIID